MTSPTVVVHETVLNVGVWLARVVATHGPTPGAAFAQRFAAMVS